MKEQIDQLTKASKLLTSILGSSLNSMPDNTHVQEAKSHIRQAINKLESVQKRQIKRKSNNQSAFDQWKDVLAGVPQAQHAPTSSIMSLDELNSMIQNEKDKLKELENKANADFDENLLTD